MLLTTSCAFAQITPTNYEWMATLIAVDESGTPISGANADIGYYTNSQPANALGTTDTNGMFSASHSALSSLAEVSLQVGKPGYYTTWVERQLGPQYDPAQWIFTQNLVLKKVGRPIAMYAKWVNSNPPILGQPVGYDLMIGDWVSPNGKGISTDIIFQKEAYRKSGVDYEYKVKVSFPKSGDGIQIYTIPDSEIGSGLRSPHETPLEGYQSELNKERSAHPGQPIKNDDDPNRIYLFRVRTAIDDRGNVVSAHYGKIYGDFMQFTYYLNPTPNDRNIEFNPKQNLIQGSDDSLKISAP
jgi:hypothetical protein